MKRFVLLLVVLLLLSGCSERIPDKGVRLDQFHQEPVYLSDLDLEADPFWFATDDVENDYVTLLVPLNTNTTRIRVYNVGNSVMECDLYLAPDQNDPIMTCRIEPEESAVFSNLSASSFYYVGMKPQGDSVDIIIQD